MTIQEHKAQGHGAIYLACKVCWSGITFDASPSADVEIDAPVTYAEARAMERALESVEAAKPSAVSVPCRQCGTYCDGDCSAQGR